MKRPFDELADLGTSADSGPLKVPRLLGKSENNLESCLSSHPSALQREPNTFCTECSKLDLEAIFSIRAGDIPHHGCPVSGYRTTLAPTCQLCNMVSSLLDVDLDEEGTAEVAGSKGWHLRIFSCVKALRLQRRRNVSEQDVVLAVTRGKPLKNPKKISLSLSRLNASLLRGVITPILTYTECLVTDSGMLRLWGREVNCPEADFSLIHEWLKRDHHSKNSNKQSFRCRVIDCQTGEIVQHDPLTKYLALSYVWGASGETDKQDSNPLIRSSQTIKDAIDVTLRLGERYLWVDRYCVPDDEKEKHLHILNMNVIYEGAFATIVAANPGPTDGANSGLYGVSKPRNTQPKLHVNTTTFVSTLPHVCYHISRSVWGTRGWTYQEAVLSTRCLFFTPDQVYYASGQVFQCESIQHSLLRSPSSMHQTLGPTLLKVEYQLQCDNVGSARAKDYLSHVLEYMKRSLTVDGDILNAFRGILARIARTSFWGLPCDARADFAEGSFGRRLCWTTEPNTKEIPGRREHFPSWSWSSVGKLNESGAASPLFVYPDVQISIEQDNGNILPLTELAKKYTESGQPIPEQSRFLHVTSWLFHVDLRFDSKSRTWSIAQLRNLHGRDLLDEKTNSMIIFGLEVHMDMPENSSSIQTAGKVVLPALFIGGVAIWRHFMCFLLLQTEMSAARRIGLLKLDVDWDLLNTGPIKELESSPKITIRLG